KRISLRSDGFAGAVDLPLDPASPALTDPAAVQPTWGRYVAAVAAELAAGIGVEGAIRTTIPVGAGLSSSAALEVAVAVALGADGTAVEIALACQRAEQRASGVPCGVMDQLASLAGVADHALLIDFRTLAVEPVPIPSDVAVVVVHSGQERELAGSAYAERVEQLERAEQVVGPLRDAALGDLAAIADLTIR